MTVGDRLQKSPMRVAILGATSHVAKNLIDQNNASHQWELELFAREPLTALENLNREGLSEGYLIHAITDLKQRSTLFDAVINCVGFGTPQKVKDAGASLFLVSEQIDDLVLDCLRERPEMKFINFSSGAVYGSVLPRPIESGYISQIELAPMKRADFYRISKIHQEAKHRAHEHLSILDVRLFSFFSRFIDRAGGYLMNDVINCLQQGRRLTTSPEDIFRDYISPRDLYAFLNLVIHGGCFNMAIDLYSLSCVSKFEMLRKLQDLFGLEFEVSDDVARSPTGAKDTYYSLDRTAHDVFKYEPRETSLECIVTELLALGIQPK